MAKISTPVEGFNGEGVGGLVFKDGSAETDNPAIIAYCRKAGYKVEGDKDGPDTDALTPPVTVPGPLAESENGTVKIGNQVPVTPSLSERTGEVNDKGQLVYPDAGDENVKVPVVDAAPEFFGEDEENSVPDDSNNPVVLDDKPDSGADTKGKKAVKK